ncbi:hypothetical protein [Dactylosporangium sp. NPDC051484]|uniref:hypothetical protein n=1 Tax=Dactylosporangium sp. NPDC051484 TaxID=3154942 RepID=UPI0034507149
MLARIDAIQTDIDDVDAQIEVHLAPFAHTAARLEQIPGIGRVAASAGRTETFLGERFRRIRRRRGPQRAIVVVGRSALVIIWHLLSNPEASYQDLGVTFYDTRINPERRARHHIRQLQALGFDVTATLPNAA